MSGASCLKPGTVALVTGASAGIGEAVAAHPVAREVAAIAARRTNRLAALVVRFPVAICENGLW